MKLLANIPKSGAFATEGAFNSDLAFKGDYALAGNYNGFTIYDIKTPSAPRRVKQVVCPGSQNDITVSGDLLFLSVDQPRTNDTCLSDALTNLGDAAAGRYWEGIRIFDIKDPANPKYIKSVETDCGSHTHTLVPGPGGQNLFLYVSSYGPGTVLSKCAPPHDKISVIKVPVDAPRTAAVVNEPVLFPKGGNPGMPETKADPGGISRTDGCHDITAYPAKGLAAGACMGQGIIMDIKDPVNPKVVDHVYDNDNFAFWHSATFSNEADKVLFTDELGGGGAPTCNPEVGPFRGANAIWTLGADRQLSFGSYYKITREQSDTENCVAHNGSLIPVEGKDVMVQAWYQGGISVFDFTNPNKATEIGWFDRGPISDERLVIGGSWSAYYYKGHIYSNDIQRGLDVLQIRDPRVNSAADEQYGPTFNPQTQPTY